MLFPWLLIHTDHRALPNPNTTATAGMLLTGSSIGRSCESNNFAIMDHLEEEHISKEKENDNSPERSSELCCLRKAPKARIKLTLRPSKIKCQVPHWGGTGLRGGQDTVKYGSSDRGPLANHNGRSCPIDIVTYVGVRIQLSLSPTGTSCVHTYPSVAFSLSVRG